MDATFMMNDTLGWFDLRGSTPIPNVVKELGLSTGPRQETGGRWFGENLMMIWQHEEAYMVDGKTYQASSTSFASIRGGKNAIDSK
jgi:hypothetical protein